jgi:methionyl-tRNA formyltransferase
VCIERQIRAFNPWPVAQTSWRGTQLRIWAAEPVDSATLAEPGTVIGTDQGGIDVLTGSGAIRLTEIQLAGRKPMSAIEFLNAHDVKGDVLGSVP